MFSGVRSSIGRRTRRDGNSHICFIVAGNLFLVYVLYEPCAMILIKPEIGTVICRLALTKSEHTREEERLILLRATQTQLSSGLLCSAVCLAQPTAQLGWECIPDLIKLQ